MKKKLPIYFLIVLFQNILFSQDNVPIWISNQSTQQSDLTFQYFRIDRKKIGNGTDVKLNTNFNYLNIFDNSQRFAPDEPSSFSSLEYTFFKKNITGNTGYQVSAGVYRNHIKGDFLLDEYIVHFGRGNSQVGLSASTHLNVQVLKILELAGSFQFGAGPHFTKLTAKENAVTPRNWGARGWGLTSNIGLWINSPIFLNHFALGIGTVFNYTYSKYGSFEVKNAGTGDIVKYDNIQFTAISKWPKPTVLFKYYFYHKNTVR